MRLHSHTMTRLPGDKLRLSAHLTDKMHRPAQVAVSYRHLEGPSASGELPVIEGDTKEVVNTLHALAEIAWESGWRPRGLPGALAAFAQLYKLPKIEG